MNISFRVAQAEVEPNTALRIGCTWERAGPERERNCSPNLKSASRDKQNQADGAQKPKNHGQPWEEG